MKPANRHYVIGIAAGLAVFLLSHGLIVWRPNPDGIRLLAQSVILGIGIMAALIEPLHRAGIIKPSSEVRNKIGGFGYILSALEIASIFYNMNTHQA